MIQAFVSILLFLPLLFPCLAAGETLKTDTVWSGQVALADDIVIPRGVTLTVRPGTVVTVSAAESTKTDPEYLSPLTEITVRGNLVVSGTKDAPVVFRLAGDPRPDGWAGIAVDGGSATFSWSRIGQAETAVSVIGGKLRADNVELTGNRYGMVVQGKDAAVAASGCRITGNDYGVFLFDGAEVAGNDLVVSGNRKKDRYAASLRQLADGVEYPLPAGLVAPRRYGDDVLLGETVWQGRILISGIVRVPENSRLVVLPGTVVEFRRRDTTGSGIGENGLLIQGVFIAKGTPRQPIFFRSGEKDRHPGDWDAINIMNSDGARNLIEYCQIEDAYRGLHFHFSNVAVNRSVLRNNYRGIQFQESAVEIRGSSFLGNRSGIQGRDSEIVFDDNTLTGNVVGANYYRVTINARRNLISGNTREGMRIRESVARVEENVIGGNRFGLLVADCFYGSFSRNVIAGNAENGFSLKNADNLDIAGNFIAGNGLNGMNLQDVRAAVTGNQISDNGERGIGIISFAGRITGNNFMANGLYAIDLDGPADVSAPGNWWGGGPAATVILDRADEARRGTVNAGSAAGKPFTFAWPTAAAPGETTWRGSMAVNGQVAVPAGSRLAVAPGTRVGFAPGAGLHVTGRILASGTRGNEIVFTSLEKTEPSSWEEILIEHADGSRFDHCVVEYATWGIHSHFTNLAVADCRFANNYGGMRFRSGPVTVSGGRFENNTIGIRSYRGNATIEGNQITGNETGIFVREKGSGLQIHRNNIFGNGSYNLRIGDFNDEDVSAENNWWGEGDPLPSIFDARQEPGIGLLRYEPFAQRPFDLNPGMVQ